MTLADAAPTAIDSVLPLLKNLTSLGGTAIILLVCWAVQKGWLRLGREFDNQAIRIEALESDNTKKDGEIAAARTLAMNLALGLRQSTKNTATLMPPTEQVLQSASEPANGR